jgi:MSHA biogenesis protein MshJ
MTSTLHQWLPLIQTRWRQARRLFDARLLNERRLIIVAVTALVWFLLDTVLITPSFKAFHEASARVKESTATRDNLQSEQMRREADMSLKEHEARKEVEVLRERIDRSKQALADQQSMLAPAREMQTLMEGLLQQGGLTLRGMRTMPPEEVKFTPLPGVGITNALLYRQGMELSVQGSYLDLLTWLRSVEEMPHKLLWDGLTLKSDEDAKLTLTLTVHTFSPDRDALEIAP